MSFQITKKELAAAMDHTVLKAETKEADVIKLCNEALEYGFASVCINPCFVKLAYSILAESDVKVCTVIGFPLGANTTSVKAFEAKEAIENGAKEIDMVIAVGMLKEGNTAYIEEDIKNVASVCKGKALLKVILECCLLDSQQIKDACLISKRAGADFVKTSTGFSTGGATEADVALMAATVGDCMGVKASGGIRNLETALKMLKAGATRLGTSASCDIVNEIK